MSKKKTLQELTIKDNFMFGAVMVDEANCRPFLERVLRFPIAKIEVHKEQSIIFHPEYKGVRLDIYAKDDKNTHYNVEMQAVRKSFIGKRSRYYHGQIDMELLLSGQPYEKLPNTYVIFVCDFDPFGQKKYLYTFERICKETEKAKLKDGSTTIFLSTQGENRNEVSIELVKFLDFVRSDLAGSTNDFEDEFISQLQRSVQRVKVSREMEGRYMLFKDVLREERQEGRAEMVLEVLQDVGSVPEEICERILMEKDLTVLKRWNRLAVNADTVEQFIQEMKA